MNRCFKAVFFTLFLSGTAYSQLFGPQKLVDETTLPAYMVRTGDFDGDSDQDLVVSFFDDVVWYENLDGEGNFGNAQSLVMGLGQVFSVHVANLDGDNDLDILLASFDDGLVLWLENDGLGNFGTAKVITDTVVGPDDVITADIDGDNDLDVVVNADVENVLRWYENLDGNGLSWTPHVVTSTVTNGRSTFSGDIDGDGDNDLVSSSSGSITLAWFQNLDGAGTFGSENVIAGTAPAVEAIFGIDLDGDDDLDILSATNSEQKIAWHENMDGIGSFGAQILISDEASSVRDVFSIDLDNDGDNDVLSIGVGDNNAKLAYYINIDGEGSFGSLQLMEGNFDGSRSVYATDIDGDMDNDVVAIIGNINGLRRIFWYENLTILGTDDLDALGIDVYPNPVREVLVVRGELPISKVKISSALGDKLIELTENFSEIPMGNFPSGLLFVEVVTEKGRFVKKVIRE